ncbi:MAG: magnesium transporter [Deltaproteobacteria bacterium]|nr:MAG: magnesium transporter [Deltaproteobacteria bacterium]
MKAEFEEERQDNRVILYHLIQTGNGPQIIAFLEKLSPAEIARFITRLGQKDQTRLLELIGPEKSAILISKISGLGAAGIVERISTADAVPIVQEMGSDQQVRILRKLKEDDAELILQDIQPNRAKEIRQLMSYPENTAGGLMITEYLPYTSRLKVHDVLEDLREHGEVYSDYDIQYAYVISDTGKLIGVLRLRDLLLAPKSKPIAEVMIKDPLKVDVSASLQVLRDFFRQYTFLGVPVTDNEGNLVGVVRSYTVREAANKRNNQLFLKFAGIVGGEEARTMPLFKRSSRRLSWLSINIVLNIIAASVIALYQDTLEKAIVLAVFLPIISDMSGCSGNQAVAVSIRELTLGLVRPRELMRVLAKESSIGIINGFVLGCLLAAAALLWKGNLYLGLVVGVSLAANTLVAVSFGGLVPLILRSMRTDPALASGPLLTTITDMCGFFLVLSSGSLLLPKLTG